MTERAKKLLLLYYKQSRKIRRVSGLPPLTFKAKKAGTLKNYRIYGNTETKTRSYSGSAPLSFPIEDGAVSNYRVYGNTVNGESVGDRTENLFDGEFLQGYWAYADGTFGGANNWVCTKKITCKANTNYTFSFNKYSRWYGYIWYDINGSFISKTDKMAINTPTILTATSPNNAAYMAVDIASYPASDTVIVPSDVTDFMLVEGSTALPYEPYGYCIPITNNSETTNIYLDAPLKKSGDNADYIDYAEQKRYNADGTSGDVTLPALPAQSSTNSLSVDTTVQPSSVAVDVAEVVSCGDKVTDSQSVNYGKYKIPVTLTAGSAETTDIYLDTPLAKSGNNADYIDYATQKRHDSDGTESSLTLPEISVTAGTNTLKIGTEVQPSGVEIKGRIKAAGGD